MTKRESQLLKGIGIMFMLFHHLFMYADQPDFPQVQSLLSPQALAAIGQVSKLCVAIFVFVTAYGTTKSFLGDDMKDTRRLMAKSISRYVRLMLSFQVVYVIAFALCPLGGKSWLTLYSPSRLENLAFAFFDFMGLSYILPSPSYNSAWWYMSLAVTMVLLLPWLIKLCRRLGIYALLPGLLLVRWLQGEFVLWRYLLLILTGIVLAQEGTIEAIRERLKGRALVQGLVCLICLGALGAGSVLWLRADERLYDLYETALVLALLPPALLVLARIPGLSSAVVFLGRHSMNMFFFHAFIYQNWFREFTYSFGRPALIWLFLLLSSLAFSIAVEALKKLLPLSLLEEKISGALISLLPKTGEGRP